MGVTISIIFFNAEQYLLNSIKSVLLQTYSNWELLLIDDGSTDNSLNIARSVKDNRIRCVSDGKRLNLASRLNQVIDLANYDIIVRMDADDLMSPLRIEKQLAILESNKNIDLVSTGLVSINEQFQICGYRIYNNNTITFQELLKQNPIVHASVIARKSWYQRNRYNPDLPVSQDYYLWLSASQKNDLNIYILNEPLYYYTESLNLNFKKIQLSGIVERVIIKKFFPNQYKYLLRSYIKNWIKNTILAIGLKKILLKRRNNNNVDFDLIKKFNDEISYIINYKVIYEKK